MIHTEKPSVFGLQSVHLASVPCLILLLFTSCASLPPPQYPDDICMIFREHPDWYAKADEAGNKWGIPIPVLMAIMHQESRFVSDAKPPRTTCLWIFPGPRPSTAYGYAQALDETWEKYKDETGNWGADRDEFQDAVDFVGWYCRRNSILCNITPDDAFHQYLAYHEGQGGYNAKTYERKPALKKIALSVKRRALEYSRQLSACEQEFAPRGRCCFWPF